MSRSCFLQSATGGDMIGPMSDVLRKLRESQTTQGTRIS